MTTPIAYRIRGPWRGDLAIVPRPRGGEWLDDEVHALKAAGFDIVVSLLTPDETQELGVSNELAATARHQMQFLSFPIPDLGVPDSASAARELLERLTGELNRGKHVAIHCRQGIGRSGLIATSLLVLAGIDPLAAFRRVSAARGLSVPETAEQKDWVVALSHDLT